MAIVGTAAAQSPVGVVSGLPLPDDNAYSTSFRYDALGNLYVWDGLNVWKQSSGAGSFNNIGAVTPGNSADAGPIVFSRDGQTILLSNGAGGAGQAGNGIFWTMPASGGSASQTPGSGVPYAYDAAALPAASTIPASSAKYIVYEGNSSYNGSTLSIFDRSTGSNRAVVANCPGATTSIAVNPRDGSVYFSAAFDSQAGKIYRFGLGQLDAAYNSGTPLDFLSGGTLFNPTATGSQSGAGMFFDNNGYLFSGGDGLTVFRPDGTICYDQAAGAADGGFFSVTFDPATNEVLKIPFASSSGTLYNAGEFEPGAWTATAGSAGSWKSGGNWLLADVPSSGTANVTFAGSLNAPLTVTLDGNQSAGSLAFDVQGSRGYTLSQGTGNGALTLGTSAGASIAVAHGTHAISAPIVLDGDLEVNLLSGTRLDVSSGIGQASGLSAALRLSGGGELVLSGTNGFSRGVTVAGGTLVLLHPFDLPDAADLTIGSTGAFAAAGAEALSISQPLASVPEPGCLGIAAVAGCAFLVLRRRFRLARPRRFA